MKNVFKKKTMQERHKVTIKLKTAVASIEYERRIYRKVQEFEKLFPFFSLRSRLLYVCICCNLQVAYINSPATKTHITQEE